MCMYCRERESLLWHLWLLYYRCGDYNRITVRHTTPRRISRVAEILDIYRLVSVGCPTYRFIHVLWLNAVYHRVAVFGLVISAYWGYYQAGTLIDMITGLTSWIGTALGCHVSLFTHLRDGSGSNSLDLISGVYSCGYHLSVVSHRLCFWTGCPYGSISGIWSVILCAFIP